MPAQQLAQTRPGARAPPGPLGVPPEIRPAWPDGRPQVHGMEADPFFADEATSTPPARWSPSPEVELFLYPGDQHLFADSSLPAYGAEAAGLFTERVLAFLAAR